MTSKRDGQGWQDGWQIVGHEHAVSVLRRAVEHDALAHAWLFGGPAGTGKGALALRLAQALLCERRETPGDAPCLECHSCRQIDAGEAPDVERITIGGVCDESQHRDHAADGSTRIRICQVRRLARVASLAPFAAARRIFILDTADELQTEAAHALLKTLEEPPATALFVLLATDPDGLLPTIRSRCQQLMLKPLPVAELAAALQAREGLTAEDAEELARLARGRYGLARRMHADPSLRVLQETATEDVRRLSVAGRNERFDYADRLADGWYRARESVLETLDVWRERWRDALLAAVEVGDAGERAASAALDCSPAQALRGLRATQRAREHLLENTNARLALEVMMLDLPRLPRSEGEGPREERREPATAPA